MIFKTLNGDLTVFNKTLISTKDHLKSLQTINATVHNKNGTFNLQGLSIESSQSVSTFTKLNNAFNVYNGNLSKSTQLQNAYIQAVSKQNTSLGNYLVKLDGAKASMGGYISSLIGAKAATIGLQVASIALNTALTMGISLIIQGVISLLTKLVNAEKDAKEATENFVSSYESLQKDISNNKKTISELQAEYEKLSKGVDSLGNSVSLTNEEYDSYKNLISQISDIMPDLAVRYNENGEAIGFVKGKLADLNAEYDKYQKNQAKDIIVNGFDDDTSMKDVFKNAGRISTWNNGITGQKSVITHNNLNENELAKAENEIQKYQDKIDLAVSGIQDALNVFAQANDDFYDLTDEQQNYVTTFLSNINQGFISWQSLDTQDNARKYVNDLIAGLKENKDGLADYIAELFSFDYDTTSLTPAEIKEKVDVIISNIAKALGVKDVGDLKVSLGFKFVDDNAKEYEHAVNKFKEKNDYGNISSSSKHNSDIDEFAKANNVTLKELEQLEEQGYDASTSIETLTSSLNAMRETASRETASSTNETPILSFQEAWDSLKSAGDDGKDVTKELIELAKAGEISDATLQSTKEYKTLIEDTGLTAREARYEIMSMVSVQEKMSGFQNQMENIASLYEEFKDKGFVTADTLEGLPDVFKEINGGKDFDLFSKIAGDPTSGKEKIKSAFDDIVTAYIKDQDILVGVTNENKDAVIANLKNAGVTNAQELVNSYISSTNQIDDVEEEFYNQSDQQRKTEIENFKKALQDKNISFTDACNVLGGNNAKLMNSFGEQYADDYANWLDLIDKKKEAYNKYVDALKRADSSNVAAQAAKGSEGASAPSFYADVKNAYTHYKNASKDEEKAKTDLAKYSKIDFDFKSLNYKPTSTGSKNKKNKDKTKETKQTFDWLERRVSVLTDKLDLLKAKIENVFSVKKKNSIIDQEIKNTNKLIKTYQKQASVYKKQANKSANSTKTETGEKKSKLSKKLKKQIQNGQIKGTRKQLIKTYGEPTANAIQEYQNYWDKYQDARKNIQTAKTDKKNQKVEQQQNWVDHYDALSDKYDAQIEGKATAKEKNKLEDKKIKSTEKSYDHQIKIAKKEYGKNSPQVAALKAERENAVREIKLEQYQHTQDEADGYRDMLEAQKENATTAKEKNGYLAQEVQYINASYDAQIKAANEQKNMALAAQLQAEWQKTLLDLQIEQLQNLSDEQSAQYDLNQQKAANADTAKEKNQYEAESRKNLQSQYAYEMQIAAANGDLVEQERLRLELEQKIEESYQKQIQNIRDEYDLILGMNDARKSTIESKIAALQANGYGIGTALYERQIALDKESYGQSLEEIKRITGELPNLSGNALKQAEIDLETEKQKAWQYQQSIAETQQAINDINIGKLERIGTLLGYYAENLEHIQNILSHSDFTLSDQDIGGLTIEGLSNMAVSFAQMSNNTEQIANLYDQIAEKQRQLTAGEYVDNGDQLTEEIDTLTKEAHDLEEANYDFGESIKDLVVDSLNSLSDALDESISKYKDALQAQKDLYDYRRKVADQLKSIASLEKQLAALQGSDTEEARARIQKLQVELEDERQNLKDTEYDKYIQDQEEMLDKVSEDFQDFIASVADMSVSEICRAMSIAVTDNLDSIGTAIERAFTESSKIGDVATSIDGLKELIESLDFAGNVSTGVDENGDLDYGVKDDKGNKVNITVDNNDSPGTVTGVTVNGENAALPKKEVTGTEDEINAAAQVDKLKRTIRGAIDLLPSYVQGREFDLTTDSFLRFLYDNFGKMPTVGQESALIKKLGVDTTQEKDEQQWEAVLKLKDFGFSHGGVAAELNKVALANGDDGWATLKRGESVLTPDQTEQFRRLTENLIPLNNIADSLVSVPDYPKITGAVDSSVNIDNVTVEAHLDGSNIVDADSFIKTLHNPRVLREVSNGVSSQLGTVMSNRLGRF